MELNRILLIVPGERQKGACGVVDYAFQMAVAAARDGTEVLMLPLYPLGDAETHFLENLPADLRPLITLQEVEGSNVMDRIRQFGDSVERFRPDCISLQFYPKLFKTGRRYLPALKELAQVLHRWPVTVTLHETWTKLGEGGVGCLLRKWIRTRDLKKGLALLNPKMVLVSNDRHFQEVTEAGFAAEMLPIISNIGRADLPEGMDLSSLLKVMAPEETLPERPLSVLFFARIIPTWDPVPFVSALRAQAAKEGKSPLIISVGETGYGDQGWLQLQKAAQGLACIKLGTRPADEISWLLQTCEWGFSPTPVDFWMKSSSCAAMVTHELPIVFSAATFNTAPPPDSWTTDGSGFHSSKLSLCKGNHVTCVNEVWKKFSACVACLCFSPPIYPAARKGSADQQGGS